MQRLPRARFFHFSNLIDAHNHDDEVVSTHAGNGIVFIGSHGNAHGRIGKYSIGVNMAHRVVDEGETIEVDTDQSALTSQLNFLYQTLLQQVRIR